MTVSDSLTALAHRWATAHSAERANFQSYITELANALGVEPPRPVGSDYEFEYPVRVVHRDGTEAVNQVDLYKRNHFLLEAKDQGTENPESVVLRKAFGQARSYAAAVEGDPPPYILVLDVDRSLLVSRSLLPPFETTLPEAGSLRYQLLTGVAGALAEGIRKKVGRVVFVVQEFRTGKTRDEKHAVNTEDFNAFVRRISRGNIGAVHPSNVVGPIEVPGSPLFVSEPSGSGARSLPRLYFLEIVCDLRV